MSSIRNLWVRARGERGFTMLLALYVLTITTLLLGAAYLAVLDDTNLTRNDLDQDRALAAAQAGIGQYTYNLNANPNYWESCPTATNVAVGAAASGSTEYYSYAPVPATGQTACSSSNPIGTMIETGGTAAGTFRISATGTSNNVSRTVVAQYKRTSFLNYVYFTNYEDEDPLWAVETNTQTRENTVTGLNCAVYEWAGRSANCQGISFGSGDVVNGPLHSNDSLYVCGSLGTDTIFGRTSADQIETPDALTEYYPPALGGGTCAGTLEIKGTANNTVGTLQPPPDDTQLLLLADGGVSTNINGCFAGYGCEFSGPTTIVADGPTSASVATNQMTVTNANYGSPLGTPTKVNYPSNGVLYVNATASCSNYSYTPFGTEDQLYGGTTLDSSSSDTDNAGCGDAVVQAYPYPGTANGTPYSTATSCGNGTTSVSGVCPYTQSLTIGAANDIIIASSLTTTSTTSGCASGWSSTGTSAPESSCPTGTAVLGLVANDMIRIFHPLGSARNTDDEEQACLTGENDTDYTNTNGTGSLINPVIDAAIFSVEHSFIVDDFDCGATSDTDGTTALGTLTVNGTIAQDFRGRVAEGNPQVSGYTKSYWYDQRLATIEPPYFLDPVSDSWDVTRLTECDASTCT
jgi:hypothetical protein